MTRRARCQEEILLGGHRKLWVTFHRIRASSPLRSAARALGLLKPQRSYFGKPSRYAPGDWVRVLDEERIRATLDRASCVRGLPFGLQQWPYCGGVYRVQKRVRRILGKHQELRPVSRTVALEGVTCGGVDGTWGCGRECPMLFRDEWLEPSQAPSERPEQVRESASWAIVRSQDEIAATLDPRGYRDGVLFMPEMYAHCGKHFPILKRITKVRELRRNVSVEIPVFVLDGLSCTGAILGAAGPCDRGCRLLWHGDWLDAFPSASSKE